MEIIVDLEDLRACTNCGVIVDITHVETKQHEYMDDVGICPVCKQDIDLE